MKSKKGYIIIRGGKILLHEDSAGGWRLPDAMPCGLKCESEDEWFTAGDYAVPVVTEDFTDGGEWQWHGLRESWMLLPEDDYRLAAKASELLFWRGQNMYCGSCGNPTRRASEISRICPRCGREIFPSPSPAILVLVIKDDEALLVHARTFTRPFYGLVAGFVETGESMEECVAREVMEETSLEIKDIRYFGSQPWPYPFNLMIGFTARYAGGQLKFADDELSDGGFFSRENHPALPTYPSLARQMIDYWLNNTNLQQ